MFEKRVNKKKLRGYYYLYYPIPTTVAVAIMRIGSNSIKVKPYDYLENKYFDIQVNINKTGENAHEM